MKKKIVLVAIMMTFAFTVIACGSNTGKTDEPANAEANIGTDVETDSSDSENEETPTASDSNETEEPDVDMTEQYKDMAGKFAIYCEQIYLGYEELGVVTAGDIIITEDTKTECRLTVYYNEPDIDIGNMSADGGIGYMEFVIDKTTSQGQLEAWNYLVGSESPDYSADSANPEVADMTGEASGYYGFPENPVFDFKEGLILSSDSVAANVNDYFTE